MLKCCVACIKDIYDIIIPLDHCLLQDHKTHRHAEFHQHEPTICSHKPSYCLFVHCRAHNAGVHWVRVLGKKKRPPSPGDVFPALPCRDDFSTISFGIQKNSGPPAECNDFYNFKIVGDKKTFSKSSVHMGETIKGMT